MENYPEKNYPALARTAARIAALLDSDGGYYLGIDHKRDPACAHFDAGIDALVASDCDDHDIDSQVAELTKALEAEANQIYKLREAATAFTDAPVASTAFTDAPVASTASTGTPIAKRSTKDSYASTNSKSWVQTLTQTTEVDSVRPPRPNSASV